MGQAEDVGRPRRGLLAAETSAVLLATFGASALTSVLDLADMSLSSGGFASRQVTLNAPAFGVVALDVARDLVYGAHLVAFAGLALVLLAKDGILPARIGLGWPGRRELCSGVGLAALIGIPGLGLYLAAHRLGLAATVAPALGYPWWRAPELLLLAFANSIAEEVVVVGYLMTRFGQLGTWWRSPRAALWASALLRGCYHLYQGPAAGLGNVVMGLVFGWAWLRPSEGGAQTTGGGGFCRRLAPLVVAHMLIDSVAFVGYPLLHGDVAWLP